MESRAVGELGASISRKERFTFLEELLYDKAGSLIAPALARRSISPNQITLAGLVAAATGAVLLLEGSRASMLGAALLLQASVLADYVDGNVARLRGMGSEFGKWLDTNCAQMADVLVFAGATAGLYRETLVPEVWAWGMFALASRFVLKSHVLSTYYSPFYRGTFEMYTGSWRVLREFVPHRPFLHLILSIGAVIDRVEWALIAIGAYCSVCYFGLWVVSYNAFKRQGSAGGPGA